MVVYPHHHRFKMSQAHRNHSKHRAAMTVALALDSRETVIAQQTVQSFIHLENECFIYHFWNRVEYFYL